MHKKNYLQRFLGLEAASGIVLFAFAAAALMWANSPYDASYRSLWQVSIANFSLHHWINDGLMAVFFLVVGLEIKREITEGELSSVQKASLPIAAALGGMIIPALIYAFLNRGTNGSAGWGIPMATDIAFALGVLSILGKRVPVALKLFLTAFAIVDDMGAVIVIALFYTAQISWFFLVLAFGILLILFVFNRIGILKTWIYLLLGVFVWFAFLKSGIHATIAGVLLAFVIPARTGIKLEHFLHSWVAFGIMPVFALANAGVSLSGGTLFHPISLGIIAGLILGKQVGVTLFSWGAVRLGYAVLPKGIRWIQLYAAGWLGGIGFTMSLFIANLAFQGSTLTNIAKLGILSASFLAGVVGAAILFLSSRKLSVAKQ
ncbi:MAG: Na+/H+ antiporter NhaA [Bdellovibrionales bacterium]|nr:Na+/H+ antiporter NhaA [Oligoflexia bacterium]